MNRLYITIIILQLIGTIVLINMYENTINDLEYDKAVLSEPYTIQHSKYCSDSFIF